MKLLSTKNHSCTQYEYASTTRTTLSIVKHHRGGNAQKSFTTCFHSSSFVQNKDFKTSTSDATSQASSHTSLDSSIDSLLVNHIKQPLQQQPHRHFIPQSVVSNPINVQQQRWFSTNSSNSNNSGQATNASKSIRSASTRKRRRKSSSIVTTNSKIKGAKSGLKSTSRKRSSKKVAKKGKESEKTLSSTTVSSPFSTRNILNEIYQKAFKCIISNDCFQYESLAKIVQNNKFTYWSCTFHCPITKKSIQTLGRINDDKFSIVFDEKYRQKSNTSPDDPASLPLYIQSEDKDVYYYQKRKIAQHACVARIFDHIPLHIKQQFIQEKDYDKSLYSSQFCDFDLDIGFSEALASIPTSTSNSGDENEEDNVYEFLYKKRNAHNFLSKLQKQYDPNIKQETVSRTTKTFSLEDDCKARNIEYDKINSSNNSMPYWRAEFTSPISNEVFHSGTMIRNNYDKPKKEFGYVYYGKMKHAKSTAICKAIDCFMHRGGWTNSGDNDYKFPNSELVGYENFCVEEPYDSKSNFLVEPKEIHNDVANLGKPERGENEDFKIYLTGDDEDGRKSTSLKYDILPKVILYQRYQALLKTAIPGDSLKTVSKDFRDMKVLYWTSTFECPVSGRVFKSGTLKQVAEQKNIANPTILTEDGIIYYSSKKDAQHAAAGRACDVLSAVNFFSSFGVNNDIETTQFCEEDPFDADCEENNALSQDNFEGGDFVEDDYADEGEIFDDDDEEFVIEQIPQAGSSTMDGSNNAMQALLDAWADSFIMSQNSEHHRLHKKEVVSTASAWCHHMRTEYNALKNNEKKCHVKDDDKKKKVFQLLQMPVSTQSCNSILKALGNVGYSNQDINDNLPSSTIHKTRTLSPISETGSTGPSQQLLSLVEDELSSLSSLPSMYERNKMPQSISMDKQNLANSIINLMVKKFDSLEAFCEPDIETFNQYIRNIHYQSPQEAAAVAESLLRDLLANKPFHGFILHPNTASFNAVMKHCVTENNYKSVLQLIQQMLDDKATTQCRPNRETFLLALNSFAQHHNNTCFDLNKARRWIECIQGFADQHPEDGLDVDIGIYNAVLPWTKNVSIQLSDQGMVDTGILLNHGENVIEGKRLNAEKIEEWVDNIDRLDVQDGNFVSTTPNIRTYEAVVQAWAEVGVTGVEKAEYWASKILEKAATNSFMKPRIETFTPIIACWACSGERSGVENVTKWIQKLDELSKTNSVLHPSGIVRSYQITAQRNYIKLGLGMTGNSSIAQIKKRLNVAEECYGDLQEIIEILQSSEINNVEMEITPFLECVDTWNDTISSSMNETEARESIENLLETIKTFDQFLEWWYRKCVSSNYEVEQAKKSNCQKEFDVQLHELHDDSAILYKNIMFNLRKTNINGIIGTHFHHVENILRRYEMHSKHIENHNLTSSTKCLELYNEVLEWCQALHHPTQYGDAIRLAMYVLDMCLRRYKAKCISAGEVEGVSLKVIDIACTVVPNDREKILLLRKVIEVMDKIGVYLEGETIRAVLPQGLDVSEVLFSPKEEELVNRIISSS